MPTIPGLENIDFFSWVAPTIKYLTYFVIGFIVIAFFGVCAYVLQFKYKATYWKVFASGTGGYSIGKQKINMFKWNRKKTSWKPLLPLFNKKEVENKYKLWYYGNLLYFRIMMIILALLFEITSIIIVITLSSPFVWYFLGFHTIFAFIVQVICIILIFIDYY